MDFWTKEQGLKNCHAEFKNPGDSEGEHDVNRAHKTHPDEAPPVGPLSNFIAKRAIKF
nr:hypothetical protein [Mucilaginibacter sp. FT3.2]